MGDLVTTRPLYMKIKIVCLVENLVEKIPEQDTEVRGARLLQRFFSLNSGCSVEQRDLKTLLNLDTFCSI